ncbi:hypothetical protein DMUE_5500 [Dictyocoela muelleri]|nr:hypothetical protein DMUE_5500 [Dictyocoela muelleri]
MFVGVDFEILLTNSAEISFKSKLSFCFFHFGQSIWQKIQQIGLSSYYLQNIAFKLDVRKIILLAFSPSTNISLAYAKIKEAMNISHEYPRLNDFFDYIEKMYIPLKHSIESEKSSTFSPHDWSVYERLKFNIPRTNNVAERWHRGLNDSIGITHPNIALFINKILDKEN